MKGSIVTVAIFASLASVFAMSIQPKDPAIQLLMNNPQYTQYLQNLYGIQPPTHTGPNPSQPNTANSVGEVSVLIDSPVVLPEAQQFLSQLPVVPHHSSVPVTQQSGTEPETEVTEVVHQQNFQVFPNVPVPDQPQETQQQTSGQGQQQPPAGQQPTTAQQTSQQGLPPQYPSLSQGMTPNNMMMLQRLSQLQQQLQQQQMLHQQQQQQQLLQQQHQLLQQQQQQQAHQQAVSGHSAINAAFLASMGPLVPGQRIPGGVVESVDGEDIEIRADNGQLISFDDRK